MKKQYVELVISAPFILVKGFLMGLIEGTGEQPTYFFSRRTGIRVETLADGLKEWLGFENLVHLCLEKAFAQRLKQAIERTHSKLGMEVKSEKRIESAGFDFKARFFKKEDGEHFHQRMDNELPEGVYLDEYEYDVKEDPDMEAETAAYAPTHRYVYEGKGRIVGDFAGVVALYLELKQNPMVDASEVTLNF